MVGGGRAAARPAGLRARRRVAQPEPVVEHQLRTPSSRSSGHRFVTAAQGQLVGGAGEVGEQHVGVGRVDHRRLGRTAEDLAGMAHEPLVELVVAGHQHGQRGCGPPGRPGRPAGRTRRWCREPREHHRRRGRRCRCRARGRWWPPRCRSVPSARASSMSRRSSARYRPGRSGRVGTAGGRPRSGGAEPGPDLVGHELGAAPEAAEHQRAQPGTHQLRRQRRGLHVERAVIPVRTPAGPSPASASWGFHRMVVRSPRGEQSALTARTPARTTPRPARPVGRWWPR